MRRQWDKTNCKIEYSSPSRVMVGRSSVTRQPIYKKGLGPRELQAYLKKAGKPAKNLFPGADETKESLIGHLHRSHEWPDDLSNDAIVTVNFNNGQQYRGQILRGVFAWRDDERKGRTGEARRTGEVIFIQIVRENEP